MVQKAVNTRSIVNDLQVSAEAGRESEDCLSSQTDSTGRVDDIGRCCQQRQQKSNVARITGKGQQVDLSGGINIRRYCLFLRILLAAALGSLCVEILQCDFRTAVGSMCFLRSKIPWTYTSGDATKCQRSFKVMKAAVEAWKQGRSS